MASKTATVGSSVGLHARPASLIAEAADKYDDEITIALVGGDDDDAPVDASSALMIMTLGAEKGATVVVSSDNQAAVDEIASLIEQDLDSE